MKFFILISLFLNAFCSYTAQNIDVDNVFANISDFLPGNKKCLAQVLEFGKDFFKEEWTIAMVDAVSKLQSGLLVGNLFDLGNFDECIKIEHHFGEEVVLGKYCALAVAISVPYEVDPSLQQLLQFRTANEKSESSNLIPIKYSICIPDGCNPTDLNPALVNLQIENVHFDDKMCQTREYGSKLDGYDVFAIVVFCNILLFMVLSTSYDVYLMKTNQKPSSALLVSFSVYTNTKKIITVNPSPEDLVCLNGLRVISMVWVIIGHRFATAQMLPWVNLKEGIEWKGQLYSQYIQGATVSVDTFLFISGVLMTYIFLRVQKKSGARFNVFLFYLHRYLRLTPALAGTYMMTVSLLRHMGSGPFWPAGMDMYNNCYKWWWTFFLYVQNYVNMDEICLIHTWYLSVDMQIFLLSPIILIPLKKWTKGTLYVLYILIFASIIIPCLIDYILQIETLKGEWYMTHERISSFLIGMALGVNLIERKKITIHWALNLLIWILVCSGMCAIILSGHDVTNHYEFTKTAVYETLKRPMWTVGLCWIVYSCLHGYGGVINWLLSLPVFQIMGRLTYSMYLLHAIVITVKTLRIRVVKYFSDFNLIYEFCGDLIFTTFFAFLWVLMFESPIIAIEKVLFGKGNKPKTQENLEGSN